MRYLRTVPAVALAAALCFPGAASASVLTPAGVTSAFSSAGSSVAPDAALGEWDAAADANGAVGEFRDVLTGDMVAVMPGGAATAASAQVLSLASSLGIPAHVVTATITKDEVNAITSALVGLRPTIPLEDSYIVSFDPSLQLVTLESAAPISAFSTVLSKYGTSIRFTTGGFVPQSRTSDGPPHWGGAAIRGLRAGVLSGCTSGFTLRNSSTGAYAMTTAGHCFDLNASVKNYKLVNGAWQGGGYSFGTNFYRSLDADFSMMSGSTYAGDIYVSESGYLAVDGASDPSIGSNYCVSGVYGGNHCSHTLVSNQTWICSNYSNNPTAVCFYADDYSGGTSGGTVTQPGDSGAPWYLQAGIKAYIRGSHVGVNGACDLHTGANCHMYATPWDAIASTYYGGYYTIVTG